MKFAKWVGFIACLSVLLQAYPVSPQVVERTIETFNWSLWGRGWSKAAGTLSLSQETPTNLPLDKSMKVEVHFFGRGFEWFSVKPIKPIWIPGEAKSVTIRYKVSAPGYTISLEFFDGWGRSEADGKRFSWALPAGDVGRWQTATFVLPKDWQRPIAINGLNVHNWEKQNEAEVLKVWVDQIDAQTDLSSTDLKTGLPLSWRPNPEGDGRRKQPPPLSLLQTELSCPAENFVFAGEQPTLVFKVRCWLPQTKKGKVSLQVFNFHGVKVFQTEKGVSLSGFTEEVFMLPIKRFGWYRGLVALSVDGEANRSEQVAFALVPPPRELTEAEKLLSPYGLNVHGGRESLAIETFRKVGVVWFRDYAFNFETMKRAKGSGLFEGWPWYHQLLWRYQRSGAKLLACLQGAIKPPRRESGAIAIGPDAAWRREIANIIASFPQVTHWELDNEYDFPAENRQAEEQTGWANYCAYHKAFAEIVDAIGRGALVAVEQGQAGIHPERIKVCIDSGNFELVQVVNVHHYCGADAPELNVVNFNPTRDLPSKARLFYDLIREAKKSAESDGRERQLWLTEFGWDTLAGHVVSPFEQAVYLQRGWLLALSAGVDKAFWFYDCDSPKPRQFFDGCGLLTADGQPKLALCALSALTYLLPTPRYIGDCNAGDGTQGFVFETDGRLVLVLWSVEGETGPVVKFEVGEIYDFLANTLKERTCRLDRAPLFVVGIPRDSLWFKQTAYSLDTPHLVVAAAGDSFPVRVKVQGNRSGKISAVIRVAVPRDWKVDRIQARVEVPPNTQTFVPFNVTVPIDETAGFKELVVSVEEGKQNLKEMRAKVLVVNPITVNVLPIEGEQGRTKLKVQLTNNSLRPMSGFLRFRLPASWHVEPDLVKVDNLEPGETRISEVDLTWTSEWRAGETAQAVFGSLGEATAWDFIVPSYLKIHRAPKIELDGELDEWSQKWAVPFWLLRSSFGEAKAKLYLAWSHEGFYIAAEIHDSIVKVTDPKNFWAGDCLELFVDTRNHKRPRSFEPGDHQFWFVPLVNEGKVYAGQWKRGKEIPETLYDLPVKGVARKTQDGYVLEVLLPAQCLQGFRPRVGARLGLNINLTVCGKGHVREVYWHRQKDRGVLHSPHLWGTVELSD